MVLDATDTPPVAFMVPLEKFIYRSANGGWNLAEPVGRKGIEVHLRQSGWEPERVSAFLKSQSYLSVYGADLFPNASEIVMDQVGRHYLNTWVPPTLLPKEGPYPRIQQVLEWITKGDQAGISWWNQWLATKIQNPALVPKVAVVMSTAQGGGKGTLAFCIRSMLGFANTEVIQREALDNRFNSRWIGKLFVMADECLGSDNVKDVSNLLKVLIDGNEIELEGKGRDQRTVKSRLAWLFASNDTVAPVVLERGDRRYTVFSNHDALPPAYVASLNGCFEANRHTPTESFSEEIAGYYHYLLNLQVDRALVARPYANEDREALINASLPAHQLFFETVQAEGIDGMLNDLVMRGDWTLAKTRPDWDFGEEGLATTAIYSVYTDFTKRIGARPLKMNKFGAALKHHRPVWPQTRCQAKGRRVNCYQPPRTPRGADV